MKSSLCLLFALSLCTFLPKPADLIAWIKLKVDVNMPNPEPAELIAMIISKLDPDRFRVSDVIKSLTALQTVIDQTQFAQVANDILSSLETDNAKNPSLPIFAKVVELKGILSTEDEVNLWYSLSSDVKYIARESLVDTAKMLSEPNMQYFFQGEIRRLYAEEGSLYSVLSWTANDYFSFKERMELLMEIVKNGSDDEMKEKVLRMLNVKEWSSEEFLKYRQRDIDSLTSYENQLEDLTKNIKSAPDVTAFTFETKVKLQSLKDSMLGEGKKNIYFDEIESKLNQLNRLQDIYQKHFIQTQRDLLLQRTVVEFWNKAERLMHTMQESESTDWNDYKDLALEYAELIPLLLSRDGSRDGPLLTMAGKLDEYNELAVQLSAMIQRLE